MDMWTVKGTFVKKEKTELSEDKKKIYPFTIFFTQDAFLKYYVSSKEERKIWIDKIAKKQGYVRIKNFYNIKANKSYYFLINE